jgi:hypothetical protein
MMEIKKVEIEYTGHKASIFIPAANAQVVKGKTILVPAEIAEDLVKQGFFKITNHEGKSPKHKKENEK